MTTTSSTDFSELDRFQHLPKTIQDYLGSLELVQLVERMVQTFKLDTSHKGRFQDFIEKVFFKDLPLMQSVAYLKNEVLPAEADAQAFFDELVKAGMFRFNDYFKDSDSLQLQQGRGVQQRVLKSESLLKPSAEDVRLRTGIDFRVQQPAKQPVSIPKPIPASRPPIVAPSLPPVVKQPRSDHLPKPISSHLMEGKQSPPAPQSRVQQMLNEFQAHLGGQRLQQRLGHLAQAFLKDIRDASETQHYLERSPKIGGLGLKLSIVEKIMKVLKQEKEAVTLAARQRLDTKKMQEQAPSFFPSDQETWPMNSEIPEAFLAPMPKAKAVARPIIDVTPSSPATPPKPLEQPPQPPTPSSFQASSPSTPLPSPPQPARTIIAVQETPQQIIPMAAASKSASKPVSTKPVAVVGPRPIPRVRRTPFASVSDRPVMLDIKHPKEVMGPIEELGRLTLRDFRDLSDTALGRTQKILEKILILEQESVGKKVDGIHAWKTSEVNQCYIEIGKASLLGNRHVTDVIRERSDRHQPTLTEEEFTAIADLNHQLRF